MTLRKTQSSYSNYLTKVTEFYQKKEVKIYINLILSLITASFFGIFAIRPTIATIASLNKEIKDQKEITDKLKEKVKNLGSAQKEYSRLAPKFHLIEAALPQEPQLSFFLGQIEVLASKNHLNLSTLQTGKTALKGIKEADSSFTVNLSLSGNYQEMKSFLQSVNHLRRMLNIKKVSIQKGKEKSSGSSLVLTLEIEVFYLPTPEEK